MKKFQQFFPFSLVILIILLASGCQKDYAPGIDLSSSPKITSKDPVALSAALKVWHGKRTTGIAPAPTGNTPALDATANPNILAIQGRYAIIKPEVTSGSLAGYYLGIPGSGQYFKIDFSKPRDIAKGFKKTANFYGRSGNADSSIVIVLPANINAPDTFCVTYCPYDSLGNIGQPVTTCIYISSLGTGSNNAWLQNDFRLTSSWVDSSGIRTELDTTRYNIMQGGIALGYSAYYCDGGNINYFPTQNSTLLGTDSSLILKSNLRFATNGGFDYTSKGTNKEANIPTNNLCSSFSYITSNYEEVTTGGYSYSDVTQKLVLIFEFDDLGVPTVEYNTYRLKKINNNHFTIQDDFYPTDFYRLER